MITNFNLVKFIKLIGFLCIAFAFFIFINVLVMEMIGEHSVGLIKLSFQYIVYGVIILGIGKIAELLE